MALPDAQAADGVPVESDIDDLLGAPAAQIEVDPALDDAEKKRLGLRIWDFGLRIGVAS